MWASVLVVLLAAELPAPAGDAPADEPAPLGLIVGGATLVVPLVVGSALMANDGSPKRQTAGVYVMASGFALAPWVAHGLEGSWRHAAIYGGISLVLSAATVVAMEEVGAFEPRVGNRQRIPMKILLPCALGSAALGVIMSVFDRGQARPPPRFSLWLMPAVGGGLATGVGWNAPL